MFQMNDELRAVVDSGEMWFDAGGKPRWTATGWKLFLAALRKNPATPPEIIDAISSMSPEELRAAWDEEDRVEAENG